MFGIRPLRSEADYDAALEAIEGYFIHEPPEGSPEADRFEVLALLIADYEAKHWAIEAPDAPDLLRVDPALCSDRREAIGGVSSCWAWSPHHADEGKGLAGGDG